MKKGLSGLNIQRRPLAIIPGAASGMKWLGTIIPALPIEQLSPPAGSRSTTVTAIPRFRA